MRLEPDKVLFYDLDSPTLVWAVELSDERSRSHFITVYEKGKRFEHGPSKPSTYHRDRSVGPIIPYRLTGDDLYYMQKWNWHYHIDLAQSPRLEDLLSAVDKQGEQCRIPESILTEVEAYLNDGSRQVSPQGVELAGAGSGGLSGVPAAGE